MPHIPDKAQASKIIDEFGELQRQAATWQPKLDRMSELRKIIENWFIDDPPDEPCTTEGKVYIVVLSARAKRRTVVGMQKLYKAIGLKTFLEYCSFSLTVLDELLRRMNIDPTGIISEERSGNRTVKAVLREAAAGSKVA